ncbi:MAG TPA: Zn-dependent hydrolase [Thermomicrobiales bacterium]|nr:Zn-dependent hydrolase [Thermomicrobiales bacterium]
MAAKPEVDRMRMLKTLASYAAIGASGNGGVTRLSLTEEDRLARERFAADAQAAGMSLRVDDMGNMVAHRPGVTDLPPLQLGSHLDTVRRGGRFDGALGVLGGLEVIRALDDAGVTTRHPLELINWTNEEGVRFEPAMMGSGVAYGVFDRAWADDRIDRDSVRFGDALDAIGYRGDVENRPAPGAALLELHVEQGPVLDDADIAVGGVEGVLGITWFNLVIEGQADHAGPSPMPLRRDALATAAEVVTMVERLAIEAGSPAVGTVGRLAPEPNLINVVPGRVEMSVDLRHQSHDELEAFVTRFEAGTRAIGRQRGVSIDIDRFWTSEPTAFHEHIVTAIEGAAAETAPSTMRLWSGAGHDAKYASDAGPAGMIFVRSCGGLSHCEEELSEDDDVIAGVATLLETVLRLDASLDPDG